MEVAVQQPTTESTCAECGKSQQDGWALYCVECLESVPAKREWVGLTDEDIADLYFGEFQMYKFARAIEANLKEKNS
jgi:hypothetical protein